MNYTITPDGKSITCLRCGRASYNLNDIEQRYCGYCHSFHEFSEEDKDTPIKTLSYWRTRAEQAVADHAKLLWSIKNFSKEEIDDLKAKIAKFVKDEKSLLAAMDAISREQIAQIRKEQQRWIAAEAERDHWKVRAERVEADHKFAEELWLAVCMDRARLKADNERLRELLAAYARHAPTCPYAVKDCDCGYNAAVRDSKAKEAK